MIHAVHQGYVYLQGHHSDAAVFWHAGAPLWATLPSEVWRLWWRRRRSWTSWSEEAADRSASCARRNSTRNILDAVGLWSLDRYNTKVTLADYLLLLDVAHFCHFSGSPQTCCAYFPELLGSRMPIWHTRTSGAFPLWKNRPWLWSKLPMRPNFTYPIQRRYVDLEDLGKTAAGPLHNQLVLFFFSGTQSFQIHLRSINGPIDVFLCSDTPVPMECSDTPAGSVQLPTSGKDFFTPLSPSFTMQTSSEGEQCSRSI